MPTLYRIYIDNNINKVDTNRVVHFIENVSKEGENTNFDKGSFRLKVYLQIMSQQ